MAASAWSRIPASSPSPTANSTSDRARALIVLGDGSNVWLSTPSGITASSVTWSPTTWRTMSVTGATVAATVRLPPDDDSDPAHPTTREATVAVATARAEAKGRRIAGRPYRNLDAIRILGPGPSGPAEAGDTSSGRAGGATV